MEEMADWSRLTPDLWGLIAERLGIADLIRFSSVCRSWRSISGPPRHGGLLPWLIVPYGDNEDNNDNKDAKMRKYENFCGTELGVFSLHDRRVYRLELPEVAGTRICGSSSTGWLATVQDNSEIKLVHAFTRSQIQLPPLTRFPDLSIVRLSEGGGIYYDDVSYDEIFELPSDYIREFYIDKFVVASLDPVHARPYVVFAIYGEYRRLAMFRPTGTGIMADTSWTLLCGSEFFSDVTYYKGLCFAVTNSNPGRVYVIDGLDSSSPCLTVLTELHLCGLGNKHYLVESSGELLIVSRYIDVGDDNEHIIPHRTTGFRVFKLDFSVLECVECKSLGGHSLFIGCNTSFSVSTVDIPSCCRSNCIYFTDDYLEKFYPRCFGGHDLGVFNLDDGTIEPCYPVGSHFIMPSPIWLATHPCYQP